MISTLALKKADYESEVGDFIGVGRGENGGGSAWPDSTTTRIQMDVKSGLRRFYWCGHPWSFLKQIVSLTLKDGENTVLFPECYAGIDGGTEVIVLDDSDVKVTKLMPTSVNRVQSMEGQGTSSGPPLLIAQRPVKGTTTGKMQQNEFYVFPEADQDYTLTFPAFFTPDYLLDEKMPYALGGVEHHETILECCLAVAEARRNDALNLHSSEAQRLLQQSIIMDQRRQPIRLGYNGDKSDGPDFNWWNRWNGHGWGDSQGGVNIDGTRYS